MIMHGQYIHILDVQIINKKDTISLAYSATALHIEDGAIKLFKCTFPEFNL